jgi:predicted dehydrogenase
VSVTTNARRETATALGVAAYRDVEAFLDHAMDAAILINDFDQHALVAMQALDRGSSVLPETAACRTIGEGVALANTSGERAVVDVGRLEPRGRARGDST